MRLLLSMGSHEGRRRQFSCLTSGVVDENLCFLDLNSVSPCSLIHPDKVAQVLDSRGPQRPCMTWGQSQVIAVFRFFPPTLHSVCS